CPEGSMFFALKGDNFDGNLYAASALEKGSAVAVVDRKDVAPEKKRRVLPKPIFSAFFISTGRYLLCLFPNRKKQGIFRCGGGFFLL
ncbi:MAG: hypothetical protein IIX70_02460, partial [Oscillospiraceae bacterium]|nr:hypothetical protein [Oscillospiraceae bacterium]